MQLADCLSGEIVARGLSMADAIAKYERLGGAKNGYALATDDDPMVKKEKPDEQGRLF